MLNKKYIKIALLIVLSVVLVAVPAFDNWFDEFEYLGENFSFLTWNTQLMAGHGEVYGFEGSPFLTSILMFGAIAFFTIANIVVSILEDRYKENAVIYGWISVAFSVISVIILIIDFKKIIDIFYGSSMDGILMGSYLVIVLAIIITVVSFINAGSNKTTVTEENTSKKNLENIDKIASLKELLDSGTITQEEFEEKKKQLLK